MASILLLGGGVLYFLDLFLSWRRLCYDYGALGVHCGTQNGLAQGVGIIDMLLALALVVTEVLVVTNADPGLLPKRRRQVEAGLAAGLLLFTVIKVLVGSSHIYIWAFVGLLLTIAIAYGGWLRWREGQAPATPPPTAQGGLPE